MGHSIESRKVNGITPFSMSLPSATPLSVMSTVQPAGSCRYPACRSSFLDSGVKVEVFNSGRERGRVTDSGRSSDIIWESVGCGSEEEEGEGKHVRVRDSGRIGGLRDCL